MRRHTGGAISHLGMAIRAGHADLTMTAVLFTTPQTSRGSEKATRLLLELHAGQLCNDS